MLIIEHDLDVVFRLATRVTVLHLGRVLADGTPDEVRADETVQRAYLGDAALDDLFFEGDRVTALLEVEGLRAGYGGSAVLHGVDLTVGEGQAVALLGRNGAGKSTLLSAVMGLLRPTAGSVRLQGRELAGRPAHLVARSGVALVPQGRRVFADLTVDQNLQVATGRRGAGPWTPDRVYQLLPQLAERRRHRADQLSGGEQQMLAIARALLLNPRLLLLDEPSDGLAPAVVARVAGLLSDLRDQGLAVLLVEQDLRTAFAVADDVTVMAQGRDRPPRSPPWSSAATPPSPPASSGSADLDAAPPLLVADAGEALGGQGRGRVEGGAGVGQRLHQVPEPGPPGLVAVVGVVGGLEVLEGRDAGRRVGGDGAHGVPPL